MTGDGKGGADAPFDVFVVGGGINGAGIARDAVGRGLSVVLCEKDDLAEGTSSRSGKLVHGGLRYLEHYEFRLVREALIEREVLMNAAPHIIWPMRFVLPHSPQARPRFLIRLGLFLYDHLGGREKLPGTRSLDLRRDLEGAPLQDQYTKGFEYSDCWVDDARLVVLNALDAAERGAKILTRHAVVSARASDGLWAVTIKNTATGETRTIHARSLVNAAGPWVTDIITRVAGANSTRNIRLVKGSHIIVAKFWEGAHAYLVQNSDRRVIFVNPYEEDLALIGTTDISIDGQPDEVRADDTEVDYLLGVVNRYFKKRLEREDVIATFSGVRPLFDDGKGNPSAVTRDYVFELDDTAGAPLLSIFGGKITTFRELAERGVTKLEHFFPQMRGPWTAAENLPGGDFDGADYEAFDSKLRAEFPWMPDDLRRHYGRLYGTRLTQIVGAATSIAGLGKHFGGNLYEAEVHYLIEVEWARTVDDILTRRTKEYLRLTDAEQHAFAAWLADLTSGAA